MTGTAAWHGPATLAVAACGALAFAALGLPAPYLSGSMVAVVVAALAGLPVTLWTPLRDLAFLITGVALGAAVDERVVGGILLYPVSLTIMLLTMVLAVVVGSAVLRRAGWDATTATLAATPGALSSVIATAVAEGARVDQIAIAQSLRLLVLVAVLPSFAHASLAPAPALAAPVMPPGQMALALAVAGAAGLLLQRLGIAAGLMLGGLVGTAGLHAAHGVSGQMPPLLVDAAMVVIGTTCGQRFGQLTALSVARLLPASLAAFLAAALVAAAGALLAAMLTGVPAGVALVAFSPGALEGMIALALSLGLDPLYVSVHHVVRFFSLGLLLPLVVPLLARRRALRAAREDRTG